MNRDQQLIDAVATFCHAHDNWANDPNIEHPTLGYWRAYDEMFEMFQSGELPDRCRELATLVYLLAAEKEKFDASDLIHPENSFWTARENLEFALRRLQNPAEQRRIESVRELDRQKVPHEQIARIWGLVNPDGSGKAWLVQQELDRPGSVIGPETATPADKDSEVDLDAARASYVALAPPVAENSPDPPCPESSQQLWLEKVPLAQAARMLKQDIEEVASEWEEFDRQRQISAVNKTEGSADLVEVGKALSHIRLDEQCRPTEWDSVNQRTGSESSSANLSVWTISELRSHAKGLQIETKGKTKESLIAAILEAEEHQQQEAT